MQYIIDSFLPEVYLLAPAQNSTKYSIRMKLNTIVKFIMNSNNTSIRLHDASHTNMCMINYTYNENKEPKEKKVKEPIVEQTDQEVSVAQISICSSM
jgi:hypothetical protein